MSGAPAGSGSSLWRHGRTGRAAIAAGLFVRLACATAQGSTRRSIRQAVCEPGMQGRMLATGRWITYGTRPPVAPCARPAHALRP
ncbi:hypothetical protein [Streptomyces sp. XH2]|uniref:hypothetical protein n=1 Tax=Streptomyces sp. XH2 TaxID=3412483 RepID=UPI003C7AD699